MVIETKNKTAGYREEANDHVTPVTTFSGRTEVDAAKLVRTSRAKRTLEQLRQSRNSILGHSQ
jgi:hypothetical protein